MARRIIKKKSATGRVLKKQIRGFESHSPDYGTGKLWGWRGEKLWVRRYWTGRYWSRNLWIGGLWSKKLLAGRYWSRKVRVGIYGARRLWGERLWHGKYRAGKCWIGAWYSRKLMAGKYWASGFCGEWRIVKFKTINNFESKYFTVGVLAMVVLLALFYRPQVSYGGMNWFAQTKWTNQVPAGTVSTLPSGETGFVSKNPPNDLESGTSASPLPLQLKPSSGTDTDTTDADFNSLDKSNIDIKDGTVRLSAESTAGGAFINMPTSPATGTGLATSIVRDGNNLHVLFHIGSSTTTGKLYYQYSPDSGASWLSQAIELKIPSSLTIKSNPVTGLGGYNGLAIDPVEKRLYAAFEASSSNGSAIFYANCSYNNPSGHCMDIASEPNVWMVSKVDESGYSDLFQFTSMVLTSDGVTQYLHIGSKAVGTYHYYNCELSADKADQSGGYCRNNKFAGNTQDWESIHSMRLASGPGNRVSIILTVGRNSLPNTWNVRYFTCDASNGVDHCRSMFSSQWLRLQLYVDTAKTKNNLMNDSIERPVDAIVNGDTAHIIYTNKANSGDYESLYYTTVKLQNNVLTQGPVEKVVVGANGNQVKTGYPIRIKLTSDGQPYIIYTVDNIVNLVTTQKMYSVVKQTNSSSWENKFIEDGGKGLDFTLRDEPLPAVTHFNTTNLRFLIVPYALNGTYTSNVVSLAGKADWRQITVTLREPLPSGTSLTARIRSGSGNLSGSSSSYFCDLSPPASAGGTTFIWGNADDSSVLKSAAGSCAWFVSNAESFRYQLFLKTNSARTLTPIIDEVSVKYYRFPASAELTSVSFYMGLYSDRPAVRTIKWKEKIRVGSSSTVTVKARTSRDKTFADRGTSWDAQFLTNDTASTCQRSGIAGQVREVVCDVLSDNPAYRNGFEYVQYSVTLGSTGDYSAEVSEVDIGYAINSSPSVVNVRAGQEDNGKVTVRYNLADSDSGDLSFQVGLFYDVGLRLLSNVGPDDLTISVSSGGHNVSTLLQSEGVVLIGNEQIKYFKIDGNSFTTLSLPNQSDRTIVRGATWWKKPDGQPLNPNKESHNQGDIVWVRATDGQIVNDSDFASFGKSIQASGEIGAGIGRGTDKIITWWPGTDIRGDIYMWGKNILVAANDGQEVKQVGKRVMDSCSGAGQPRCALAVTDPNFGFTLDTKAPAFEIDTNLFSPVTIGGGNVVEVSGGTKKTKETSVQLTVEAQKSNSAGGSPAWDPNNNDPSQNKLLTCLNLITVVSGQEQVPDRCGTPTIDQIVGNSPLSSDLWARANLTLASQIISVSLVNTTDMTADAIREIKIIVYDNAGNYDIFSDTKTQRRITLDRTAPPAPANLSARDASTRTTEGVFPLIYLQWTPLDGTAVKDASGQGDFGGYRILRNNITGCGTAFCELDERSKITTASATDSNVDTSTTYSYQILAFDNVGNVSAALPAGGTPGVKPTPPTDTSLLAAPVILGVPTASDITWNSAKINWNTDVPSDGLVVYAFRGAADFSQDPNAQYPSGPCAAYVQPANADGTPNFSGSPSTGKLDPPETIHNITVTGLQAGSCYFVQVQSRRLNGIGPGIYPRIASDQKIVVVTTQPPPVETPNIALCSGLSSPVERKDSQSISFCWTTDKQANSFVEYRGPNISGSVMSGKDEAVTDHRVTTSGLSALTTYEYRLRSKIGGQGEGYYPSSSGWLTETTAAADQDTTAPEVTAAPLSASITDTTATIRVISDDIATHNVDFWPSEEPNNKRTLPTAPGTPGLSTDIMLDNLSAGATYSYEGWAQNASNLIGRSATGTFTTDSFANYTSPPNFTSSPPLKHDPPTVTTATIYFNTDQPTQGKVDIAIDDPSNFWSSQQVLFADDGQHVVTLWGLTPSTTYYYKVTVENPSRLTNQSSDCGGGDNSCFFTTDIQRGDLPEIRLTSIKVLRNNPDKQNEITIEWDTGPEGKPLVASTSLVEFGHDDVDGLPQYGRTFGNVSDLVSRHSVTLPIDLIEDQTYFFRVRSRDAAKQEQVFPVSVGPNDLPCLDPNPMLATCRNPAFTTFDTGLDPTSELRTPPQITGVGVLLVTNTKVVIGWNTDKPADSEVLLGLGPTYCSEQDPWGCPKKDPLLTQAHAVTIEPLSASTSYFFSVASTDRKQEQRISKTQPDATDLPLPTGLDCQGTYCFKTTAGTEAVSQEAADALQAEIDRLKELISDTEGELGDPTLTPEQRAALEKELADLKKLLTELQGRQQGAIKYDTMPPIIADVQVSDITETSAQVRWNTNEQATSIVRFGESEAYSRLAGDTTVFTTSHKVDLKRLDPGTDYHFQVVSYDREGNGAVSGDNTFKTKGVKGEKAEETEEGEDKKGEKSKKGQDEIDEAMKKIQELTKDKKISVEKILELLKDFNEEDISKILASLGVQLVSPPKFVGGVPRVEVTTTTAAISWETDKESDSRVAWVTDADYRSGRDEPYTTETGDTQTFVTEHKVTISGLEPNTLYHYQLRSRERAGRTARSIDRTFKTLPLQPEVTNVRVAKATENEVTLTWKTNVATKSTIEYTNLKTKNKRSQGDPQFVTIHQFTLSGLEADSRFSAVIRAEDETGLTAVSDNFGFTTVRDVVVPEIAQVRTDVTLSPGKSEYAQAIITWRTNEPSSSQVMYEEGITQSPNLKNSSPETAEYLLNHVVVLNKLRAATVYRFRVVSADPAGNKAISRDFTLLTPQKKETVLEIIIKNFEETFGFLKSFGR